MSETKIKQIYELQILLLCVCVGMKVFIAGACSWRKQNYKGEYRFCAMCKQPAVQDLSAYIAVCACEVVCR